MESQNNRNYLYLLKAFAIFSVVCAHTAVEPENSSKSIHMAVRFLSSIGTAGVPVFFIISGYLFYGNQRGVKEFVERKLKSIVVPWIFCETIVWLYVVLRKNGAGFWEWLKFILGVYHSTYYLTMLVFMYVLFWKIKKYDVFSGICLIVSCSSILSLGWKIPFAVRWNEWTITPYLNVFNWMMYFVAGMCLKKKDGLEATAVLAGKLLPVSIPLLIADFFIHDRCALSWTYFSKYALLNITLQVLVIMGVSYLLCRRNADMLISVGKYSFTIYLLHELSVGIVVWITARSGSSILILQRPFIVIMIMVVAIYFIQIICLHFEKMKGLPGLLTG